MVFTCLDTRHSLFTFSAVARRLQESKWKLLKRFLSLAKNTIIWRMNKLRVTWLPGTFCLKLFCFYLCLTNQLENDTMRTHVSNFIEETNTLDILSLRLGHFRCFQETRARWLTQFSMVRFSTFYRSKALTLHW